MTFQHSIVNNIVVSGVGTTQEGRVLCDTCSGIVAALEALAGTKLTSTRGNEKAHELCEEAIENIKAGRARRARLSEIFS